MAKDRLAEAELLCANDFLQGAYYLAGYAVEFSLKSLICKRLGVEVFYQPKGTLNPWSSTVAKALQIHELPALLVFAGIHPNLKTALLKKSFFTDWSKVSEWDEQRRYQPIGSNKQIVIEFIKSAKRIMEWVETHYQTFWPNYFAQNKKRVFYTLTPFALLLLMVEWLANRIY